MEPIATGSSRRGSRLSPRSPLRAPHDGGRGLGLPRWVARSTGDVIDVSADRLTDKRTGTPYYTALVKVDEKELAGTSEFQLYPGMAVTVMIPTKKRTAL